MTEQEKIQLERNKVNQTFIPTSTLTELSILKHAGKKKDLRGRNQSLPPQLRTMDDHGPKADRSITFKELLRENTQPGKKSLDKTKEEKQLKRED